MKLKVSRRMTAASALASAIILAGSAMSATAVPTTAVSHCGATSVNYTAGTAIVPSANHYRTFSTSYGDGSILYCGNGTTWGAVHIEVKHKPPTWSVADQCATKIEDHHTSRTTQSGGKTVFKLSLGSNRYAVLVFGANGVVTNYVSDGRATSWSACANY